MAKTTAMPNPKKANAIYSSVIDLLDAGNAMQKSIPSVEAEQAEETPVSSDTSAFPP